MGGHKKLVQIARLKGCFVTIYPLPLWVMMKTSHIEGRPEMETINLDNVQWTAAAYEPYREIVDFECGCIGKAATAHSKEVIVIECKECQVLSGVLSGEIVPEDNEELLEATQLAIWARRNETGARKSTLQEAVEAEAFALRQMLVA